LGLLARRLDRLETLRQTLAPDTVVRRIDVTHEAAAAILDDVFDELGGVDLIIISAGTGHNNRDLNVDLDAETVAVNILGFSTAAQRAVRHFLKRGPGQLVGISSMAALRGNAVTAARQIVRTVRRHAKHAYGTKRYALLAFMLKLRPRPA
jgi:short-subunit dehydrogenase